MPSGSATRGGAARCTSPIAILCLLTTRRFVVNGTKVDTSTLYASVHVIERSPRRDL